MSNLGRYLESQLRKQLHEHEMIPEHGGIAIALSGGKDSLTMLHLMARIRGRGFRDFPMIAIHVGGAFSCGAGVNEAFLRRTCAALDVPLTVCHTSQSLDDLECYSCSRQRRSLIFNAALQQGCPTVAFGHHRDDAIQTLLLNLFHKGEFCGNLPVVPMHRYGITIIRPLMLMSEDDIRRFAQNEGFARVTCQCPVGANSKRKTVEELIKNIEQDFPHLRKNLYHAMQSYGSNKAALPPDQDSASKMVSKHHLILT